MTTDAAGVASTPQAAPAPAQAGTRDADLPSPPESWEGPVAALWVGASVAPVCAAVLAVLIYPLLPSQPGSSPPAPQWPIAAVGISVVVTAVLWLILIRLLVPLMSAQKSQPRFYSELVERYQQLRDRLASAVDGGTGAATDLREAQTQLDYARRSLFGPDGVPALRWALAHGYVSVLRSLHRVEEVSLLVEPVETLLGDAAHDELSLDQSTIATRDSLRAQLTAAKAALSGVPQAAAAPAGPAAAPPAPPAGQLTERQARETLRAVRNVINVFRDDARNGVIRARNQLLVAMLVVSLATFVLLGLGEAIGVPTLYVVSVAALYLVGVVVGLFNRLRIEAKRSSAGEDFGLFQSRLLATVLMSGLAAIFGVYLVAALPALLPVGGSTLRVPSLATIFDLSANQAAFLYAAVFGVAPEALTNLLLQGADKLQNDLLSSRPATTTTE